MHSSALRARLALLVALVILGIGVQAPVALAYVDAAAPPNAVDDVETVRSGQAEFLAVTANDSDPDGDPLTITSPTLDTPVPTAHGTVTCFMFGDCEYVSNAGYGGPDSFNYTISDGNGGTDTAAVSISVTTNTPPTAVDDELQATSGNPISYFVLANDVDPDEPEGDFLTLTAPTPDVETDTAHGTVTCADYGECEYTSDAGYLGADGFDYAIIDDSGASDSAHVAITVSANGAPDAVDDTYARGDDLVLEVLTNDTDPEGGFFKITAVTQPAHGAATISGDEDTVTYTQTSNFSATDSFTYTITDSGGGTDTATVTLQACPALAPAFDGGGIVTSERWVACSALRANGVVGPTTTVLPPQGGQSALLTSGDIALAPGPNDSSGATASNGTELRGARDVSILRLDLMIPAGANCLSFDFAFQSEEYPEFVNSPYNDAFLAELDASTWSVANSVITAPNNFAFDSAGGIVSINGSFFEPDRVVTDTGSQYDGSTPLLSVRTPVTPGAHVLYLSIFDAGDTALDSAAFVDGLVAGTAGPGGCSAGANEPPNAVNDGFESPEDTVTAPFNVLVNDSDPDAGQTLTVTTLSPSAQHGTVSCTAAGMCTYTPAPNYHGPDSFTYGISDGHGGTDTATVSITVTPVNDEPTAVNDVLTTPMNTEGTVNVLANDSDIDGDSLAIAGQTHGTHGTVSCVASSCTYTPNAGYFGPDSFTYFLSDGHGGLQSATVSVTVTAPPTNQPPVADDETLTVAEDTPGNVSVLPGDTDPDGDTLTVTTLNPTAAHGTVVCTAAGVCTYTPNANYNGPDGFDYTVSDGHGGTDTGHVSITVTAVNDNPDAVNNSLTTPEDTAGNVNVLANDSDVDGDSLTVTTLTPGAAHGTVACTAAGVCTYTPNANYNGSDSFTYSVSDGHGGSDTATVNVTVTPVNDDPNAVDNSLTTAEDTAANLNVLANDTDLDGDSLTVTTLTPTAAHGTVSCTAAGVCTYTPNANYNGSDSFTYSVSDGHGGTDTATVSVTVTPVNDSPDAVNNSLTTPEDTAGNVNVLANDSDVDGDSLTVTTLTPGAAHGTVACTAAGVCTYTPNANYNGPDSFTYSVSDGHGGSDTATVNVTVTPVNDDPNAVDNTLNTGLSTAGQVNVLANDTDVDGDTLTVTTLTPTATHGTVSCTAVGVCTYTPEAGYAGPDSFTYAISDAHGGTDSASVSVTVTANQPPVADDEALTTPEDTAAEVNVLVGDADPDGNALTVTSSSPAADHGTVSCSTAGLCTYTPSPNYHGPDGFDYTVSDGHGGTDTGHVSITVSPVNDDPNAINDSVTTDEDTAKVVSVLGNDGDVDGDSLTVTTAAPTAAHGTVACTSAGECTYTPTSNYNGPDSFTYTVSDSHGGSDTATVNVTVTPVNDPPNAVDDSFTTAQDTALIVNVFGNDSDPDSPFMLTGTTQPAHGSVFCTIAGDCTYTPNAGFTGSDSFTYTIGDGLAEDTATVTITVTAAEPENTPPSCADVKPSKTKLWPPRHKFIVVTLSGATDADGDPLTFSITKVTQDEKVKGAISKNDKGPDAQRVPGKPNQIKLRAERVGDGNGRVYRIHYVVSDGQGGTCAGIEKVGVPRNKNGNAIDNVAKKYDSFG